MVYLCLALFVYVCFALKNNKIIKTTLGNEIIVPAKEKEQKISWLAVVVLILFSGLRAHSVGGDLGVYNTNFMDIAKDHNINAGYQSYGLFFKILNWCCSFLPVTTGFHMMLIILAIMNILLMVFAVKKLSPDISLTMFLIMCIDVFIPSLSMLRQGVAVSLIILSFKYIYEKNWRLFLVCVISAACFHESALFLLPTYFFNFFCDKKKCYVLYGLGFLVFFIFAIYDHDIVRWLCKMLGWHYYASYKIQGSALTMFSYIKNIGMILVFAFFLIYKIFRDAVNKPLNRMFVLSLNMFFIVALICVYNIVSGGFLIISRMIYYFSWSIILIVPHFIGEIKNKKHRAFFTIAAVIIGLLYLSTTVVIRDQFNVVPYSTIFG